MERAKRKTLQAHNLKSQFSLMKLGAGLLRLPEVGQRDTMDGDDTASTYKSPVAKKSTDTDGRGDRRIVR